ncbi:MAG: ADP-forming succinate--CoA ligase subunit beta, partial [Gammaproteobacteria bacterium]
MHLHEYQAKKLFAEYGIPVAPGKPAHSVKEALRNATEIKGPGWVVKAQVHAGGRGKAGGVKLVRSMDELETTVRNLLGTRLVTRQSAPLGQPVNCVLVTGVSEIEKEFYLAMLVDRSTKRIVLIASSEGGMDIEEVAATRPDRIINSIVDPVLGIQRFQSLRIGGLLGLDEKQQQQLHQIVKRLYQLFNDKDLSLIEINPLIINGNGMLEALDAKISIDDNALFRQANLEEWRDMSQEDEKENIAKRYDLNYVTLDGNIACMVNGAGLAMATMD